MEEARVIVLPGKWIFCSRKDAGFDVFIYNTSDPILATLIFTLIFDIFELIMETMTTEEFNSELELRLGKLPFNRLVEFALDICNRLYVDYAKFHDQNDWGSPTVLQEAILFCTNLDRVNDAKAIELSTAVEAVTPDTDDFGDWDGSYALNACTAIIDLLEYIVDRDISHILYISSYITDTIDFKLQEADDDLTPQQLINHPTIIEEWERQLNFLNNN